MNDNAAFYKKMADDCLAGLTRANKFETAAAAWRDLQDLRVTLSVWRWRSASGELRPHCHLIAACGDEMLGGVRVAVR